MKPNPRTAALSQRTSALPVANESVGALNPSRIAGAVIRFVADELPSLNCACRDRAMSLRGWTDAVAPVVSSAVAAVDSSNSATRRILHRASGMIHLAAENHAQSRGLQPGEILAALPGLPGLLHSCAGPDKRPVLSHHGYWLQNVPPHRFTFTGSSSEMFFISAVQAQTTLRRATHELLKPVCGEAVDMASSQASRLIAGALASIEQGQLQFRDFYSGPDGHPGQTAAEFNEMRQWLPETRIGSISYGGPNAAYIPDMVATDFVIGTADLQYEQYTQQVLRSLDPEDRAVLQEYVDRRSVLDVLSSALGYKDGSAMGRVPSTDVASRLSLAPMNLRATAVAARALHRAFCGSSGAHAGLIVTHLERYAGELTTEQLAKLTVSPTAGVGGHAHDHTRQIHDTRRSTPAWINLADALKMLPTLGQATTKRPRVASRCESDRA